MQDLAYPSILDDPRSLRFLCVSIYVRVCLAVEVTWEDQQRGLNGSLSDGGTQPQASPTDTGWLVWLWISDTSDIFHFDRVLDFLKSEQ